MAFLSQVLLSLVNNLLLKSSVLIVKASEPATEEEIEDQEMQKQRQIQRGNNWGYDNENGPHTWARLFPKATGSFQSPINIEYSKAIFSARLNNPPLFFNYRELHNCQLSNTGYSFQVSCDSDLATVDGGPLLWRYQFAQFHMHWGSGDRWGSEHALNGRLFPAELHLVHWNSNKFSSFQEAAAIKDGLTVLGVFVDIGDEHPAIGQVMRHFSVIQSPDTGVGLSSAINLNDFLPKDRHDFFTYEGSLTTPPCFESVRWIVFRQPITMSRNQFTTLRSLYGKSECGRLVDNYRHLIPLGNRKLQASCPPDAHKNGI